MYQDGTLIIDLTNDVVTRNTAVNDYSLNGQKFFIKRVKDWLNTVGKEVLGIEHYWGRFEIAKGRGQIHAHLLAILKKEIKDKLQWKLLIKNVSPEKEA